MKATKNPLLLIYEKVIKVEVSNREQIRAYLNWNNQMWYEFRKENKYDDDAVMVEEFIAWLKDRFNLE